MPVTGCLNKNGDSLQPPRLRRSPEKSPSGTNCGGIRTAVDAGLRCDYSYIGQVLREEDPMARVALAQLKASVESPWLNCLIFGIDPTENGSRDLRGGTLTGL